MEFRDFAAKETSALLTRLLANQAEASLQQIRSLRDALEAAVHTIETSAGGAPQIEKELQELIRRLNSAAGTAARAAAQKVQEEARGLLDAAHQELETQRGRTEELEISLAAVRSHSDSLQSELSAQAERIDALARDLAAARESHDQAESARQETEIARREQADARAAVEDELRETRGLLDAALSEAARLGGQVETEAIENTRLIGELSAARAELHTAEMARDTISLERNDIAVERDTLATERDVIAAERDAMAAERNLVAAERDAAAAERNLVAAERDAMAARLDAVNGRMLALESAQSGYDESIRNLEAQLAAASEAEARLREQGTGEEDRAKSEAATLRGETERLESLIEAAVHAADDLAAANSISELLGATVRQLSGHFSRVALFRVKGNRLEGEHQIGFDLATDVTKLVIPINVDSLITRALGSRKVETLTGAELTDSRLAPFGTLAAAALAIPIVLQDETMAVVYAEESDAELSPVLHQSRIRFATLLIRHAVALLMHLTQELKALSELRDYAALLLKEAEEMHSADSDGGRDEEEIRRRLKDNIDCARQLFVQRASMDGPTAAGLLDEQIADAVCADTPFARDLSAVGGHAGASGRHANRAAEAS
jgi:predicted  nucleic acid-binding Zn-ribbon protein